jgi:hypothetical protein
MKQAIRIGGKIVQVKEFEALPDDAAPLWTPDKDEILRQYYPKKNATALAAKFGVTRAALTRHASAIGVHKARYKVEEKQHA